MELSAQTAVLDVLCRACSQDASVLKPAEEQLRQWESQPGFYSILATVFMKHDLDVSVRLLAVLYFKNGIDRYWRRNAPGAISEAEKDAMRLKLIADFDEPVPQIAVQLSLLISKIARLDCPRSWPQLIPTLLNAIRVDDILCQQRAMLTFYRVVKALASRRLPPDRKVFEELTSNIFGYIFEMWESKNADFYGNLRNGNSPMCTMLFGRCQLSLKVLRKLIVFGFSDLDKNRTANEFLKLVFHRLEQFLKSKSEIESSGAEMPQCREKMITLLSKVPLDVQENHPEAFIPYIRTSLELTIVFNFTPQGNGLVFERFTVNMLNLMRNIIRCDAYRPAKTISETKNPVTLAVQSLIQDFFTNQVLTELCRQLVLRYFLLTESELRCWQNDPESYVSDESGDSCKFSLRPCQQSLFLALVKEFREVLTHLIMELVKEFDRTADPEDVSAILQKDAVYYAIGLASFDMYDLVDFDSWLSNTLINELRVSHANYRIIRRRIVWLIGCWVGVRSSPERRPAIYECLIPLLQRSEDLVIRIEAAQTLKLTVDDFEFNPVQFAPYLEPSFSQLFQLLQDVNECDTKMTVLHVMSFIIERMQAEIRPHVGALVQYLPMLWDSSAEHGMLRCAIISTLSVLVQSVGASCVEMYNLLLPIIQSSTDVKHVSHVYLYEDGLDLWMSTIQSSPSITPHLLDVFANMSAILELGSETMKTSLKLIEAYIMLGGNEFLRRYGTSLVTSLTSLLAEIKPEASVLVYKVVETALRVSPEEGARLFSPMCIDVVRAVLESEDYPQLTTMHLAILSRLILSVPNVFSSLLDIVARQHSCLSSELLGSLLDRWFDKMDSIGSAEKKKLATLALLSLLTTASSCVLERFGSIMSCSVEVLHDICRVESEIGVHTDCLVITRNADISGEELETEHDRRRYQLSLRDPVHSVSLRDYVIVQLGNLRTQVGDTTVSTLMESVDCEISIQLQHFLK